MPNYFPEDDTPLPTDSFERLLQKAVSIVSKRNGGDDAPAPLDSAETLMFKLVKRLNAALVLRSGSGSSGSGGGVGLI